MVVLAVLVRSGHHREQPLPVPVPVPAAMEVSVVSATAVSAALEALCQQALQHP
jgi:hypothetical protein